MKKLLAVMFCAAVLSGCGDSLPSECTSAIKEYDSLITELSKQDNLPAATKEQIQSARDGLQTELKKLSKDDAIKTCKAASASFAQMKQMLPKN